MTVTLKDGLFTFGTNEVVQIPPDLTASPYGSIANTNDAEQKAPLGILYRHKGNVYRYVQYEAGQDAVAAAAGGVVHWYSLDPANGKFVVTGDFSDSGGASVGAKNLCAGILGCVVTDQYYTWIQVGGVVLLAKVNTSNAAGDVMIYSNTDLTFGRCAADAAVTGTPFGVALAVDNPSGFGPVLLLNMIF